MPGTPAAPMPAATPDSSGFSEQRLQRLHRFMQDATGPEGYLGGVTLIARDGKIVDWRAYGHRDLARRSPMDKDSIFRIYSMTKTVTSVAVLMLVEEGKITLDDPIARHLPGIRQDAGADRRHRRAPKLRPAANRSPSASC